MKEKKGEKTVLSWSVFASLVVALTGPLAAGTEGRVAGTVVDQAGKPLKDVQVVVNAVEVEFQQTRTSNNKGRFTLVLLDASRDYVIRLEKEGYQPIQETLKPKIGGILRHTWILVEGQAPGAGLGEAPPEIEAAKRVVKLYEAAYKAFNVGDLETAVQKFHEVLELAPDIPEPHGGLAMAYYRMDDYEQAAAEADRLLELDEGNVIGVREQYEAYRALGDTEREAAALAQLEVLDPGPETARRVFNSGVPHVKAGELEAAVACFERAIEMDPELAPAYAALARVYLKLGDYEKSVANGERLLELQPDNAAILNLLYGAYRSRGESEKAEAAFAALSAASPEYVGSSFYEQGVTHFNNGNTAEAKEIFQRVLEAQPDHPQAHYMFALCLINASQLERAKEHLSRFLELVPDDPEAPIARQMLESL